MTDASSSSEESEISDSNNHNKQGSQLVQFFIIFHWNWKKNLFSVVYMLVVVYMLPFLKQNGVNFE